MAAPKIILCIADAPGPAEMLAPVIPLLGKDCEVRVVAVGTAMSILEPLGAILCNDISAAQDVFEQSKPDLLVSAISSLAQGPYINNTFVQMGHTYGIPVISLQDIWGNHRWPQNKDIGSRINAVCVPDEFAASLWKDDGFTKDIFVTGNPAFDRFAVMDTLKERTRIRIQLGLNKNERVLLYAGQGTPYHIEQDKKTFAYVADAIRALNETMPVTLIARPHPRAIETDYYKKYSRDINTLDTSSFAFADNLLPIADAVIAMTSTSLVHACYLRIPGVSVLLTGQGRALLAQIGLDDFPSNIMGATAGVYDDDPAALQKILEKIFTDASFCVRMHACQEKNFPLDGGAARRIMAMIKKFL